MSNTHALQSLQAANIQPQPLPKAGSDGTIEKRASTQAPVAASLSPVDETSLSPASALLSQALKVNDARLEKVAALRQSIADGTYNVPSADVANKLVQTLLG